MGKASSTAAKIKDRTGFQPDLPFDQRSKNKALEGQGFILEKSNLSKQEQALRSMQNEPSVCPKLRPRLLRLCHKKDVLRKSRSLPKVLGRMDFVAFASMVRNKI